MQYYKDDTKRNKRLRLPHGIAANNHNNAQFYIATHTIKMKTDQVNVIITEKMPGVKISSNMYYKSDIAYRGGLSSLHEATLWHEGKVKTRSFDDSKQRLSSFVLWLTQPMYI